MKVSSADEPAGGPRTTVGKLFGALRSRRAFQLEWLEQLVTIDSQWSNPAGVRELTDRVVDRLEAGGFTSERHPQPDVAASDRWLAELLAPGVRYESLAETTVLRRGGRGDAPVLLLADADTAFRGGPEAETAFRVEQESAYGTGVADMKAGLVVLAEALAVADEYGVETPPLVVVLSGDEQAGSLGSGEVIRREARSCPVAFCLECARDGGKLMASRAQVGVGMIEARGRESHAGTARADGVSAIDALARVIPGIEALTRDPDRLVTVTMISGGRRRSVVPGSATAVLDVRTGEADAWKVMVDDLHAVVDASRHDARLTVRVAAHRPAVPWNRSTDELLAGLGVLGEAIGVRVDATRSMAAGSSAFAAEAGATVVDGLGSPGGQLMTDREHVSVPGIAERAALLAGLLHDFATGSSSPAGQAASEQGR